MALLWTYELKDDCTSIQFGEANELYFIYQNRAKVLLGTFNNLDYKLKFAAYLLHNEDGKGIGDTEQGTLDVSHQLEDGACGPTCRPGPSQLRIPLRPIPRRQSRPAKAIPDRATEPPRRMRERTDRPMEQRAAIRLPRRIQPVRRQRRSPLRNRLHERIRSSVLQRGAQEAALPLFCARKRVT